MLKKRCVTIHEVVCDFCNNIIMEDEFFLIGVETYGLYDDSSEKHYHENCYNKNKYRILGKSLIPGRIDNLKPNEDPGVDLDISKTTQRDVKKNCKCCGREDKVNVVDEYFNYYEPGDYHKVYVRKDID